MTTSRQTPVTHTKSSAVLQVAVELETRQLKTTHSHTMPLLYNIHCKCFPNQHCRSKQFTLLKSTTNEWTNEAVERYCVIVL